MSTHTAANAERWLSALLALEPDAPRGAWGMTAKHARAALGRGAPSGREASNRIVDINRRRKVPRDYWTRLKTAANAHGIPPVILCAIADRESNQGAALDRHGYGDHGHGFGVCQVDDRSHHALGAPDPFSLAHLDQAAGIFAHGLALVCAAHPDWDDRYLLKGGLVAYNAGPGTVRTINHMDDGSTGDDYGADTAARAQYLYQILGQQT